MIRFRRHSVFVLIALSSIARYLLSPTNGFLMDWRFSTFWVFLFFSLVMFAPYISSVFWPIVFWRRCSFLCPVFVVYVYASLFLASCELSSLVIAAIGQCGLMGRRVVQVPLAQNPSPSPHTKPHIRLIFIIVFHFEAICDKIIQFVYPYYLIMFLISSLFLKFARHILLSGSFFLLSTIKMHVHVLSFPDLCSFFLFLVRGEVA